MVAEHISSQGDDEELNLNALRDDVLAGRHPRPTEAGAADVVEPPTELAPNEPSLTKLREIARKRDKPLDSSHREDADR